MAAKESGPVEKEAAEEPQQTAAAAATAAPAQPLAQAECLGAVSEPQPPAPAAALAKPLAADNEIDEASSATVVAAKVEEEEKDDATTTVADAAMEAKAELQAQVPARGVHESPLPT